MDIQVEIESTEVIIKSGNSAKTGKPYQIREQRAYVTLPGQKYPQNIKVTLDDNSAPYPPGIYTVGPDSFFVGRFEDLQMRLRLVPFVRQVSSPSRNPVQQAS